jgi:hypothetical protein
MTLSNVLATFITVLSLLTTIWLLAAPPTAGVHYLNGSPIICCTKSEQYLTLMHLAFGYLGQLP